DISWKKGRGAEDEDVDMIPLIDVSLVLLIFFMLTATVAGAGGIIPTPRARHTSNVASTAFWIGVDCRKDRDRVPLKDGGRNYVPVYSLGQGDKLAEPDAWELPSREEMLKHFDKLVAPGDRVEVRIKANPLLPYEVIRDLTVALEPRKHRNQI